MSFMKGFTIKWPFWLIEFIFLLTCLCLFPPHKQIPFPKINISKIFLAQPGVNLALGRLKRGGVPYFSTEFIDLSTQAYVSNPMKFPFIDLHAGFQDHLWPDRMEIVYFFKGIDLGETYAISTLWNLTKNYSINTIIFGYRLLHFLGVFLMFFLVLMFQKKWLALALSLLFAYSHFLLESVFTFGFSLWVPSFLLLILGFVLLSLFLMEKHKPFWSSILAIMMGGLLLGIGSFFRSTVFYSMIPISIFLLLNGFLGKKYSILILFFVFALTGLITKHLIYQAVYTPDRVQVLGIKGHVFWHSIWGGLGEVENPYGFVWQDSAIKKYVESVDAKIQFATPEYENILKGHVLKTFKEHPTWFVGLFFYRLNSISKRWSIILPWGNHIPPWMSKGLFFLSILCFPVWIFFHHQEFSSLFVGTFMFFYTVPLVVYSNLDHYNLSAYLGTAFTLWICFDFCLRRLRSRLAPSCRVKGIY